MNRMTRRGLLLGGASVLGFSAAAAQASLLLKGAGSAGSAPATAFTATFGSLSRGNAGSGVPTAATAITSGDASGHWQITGGNLCPSAAGDTANLNLGPYALTLNNGHTYALTIEANCWSVASQAEWDFVIAQVTATLSAKIIRARKLSSGNYVSGVDGTAARLRRADFGGLVIKADDLTMKPIFNKFFLRGTRNVTFQGLETTKVAETKFQLTGEIANHLFGITIDQCDVSGQVGDPNGDYAVSANYPNRNIDLITTTGSANNANGSIAVTNCLVEWSGTGIGLRVDRDASATLTVTGNKVRYFYDDAIGLTKTTLTSAAWYDCVTTVADNVVTECVGRSTDSDAPHCDAIRFISLNTVLSDWTVYIHRNRIFQGNARGNLHLQGILASDYKNPSGDAGYFYKGSAIGNIVCTDNSVSIDIQNAKDFVALNNTCVNSNLSTAVNTETLRLGSGSLYSTTSGTHRVERNIAEAYGLGGSPTLVSNLTLGKMGVTIPYANVFDGGGAYPNTLAELMAWFNRKVGGNADISGTPDIGAIGATAVTFATSVPGSDGVNLVS